MQWIAELSNHCTRVFFNHRSVTFINHIVNQLGNRWVLVPEQVGEFPLWPAIRPEAHMEDNICARTLPVRLLPGSGISSLLQRFHWLRRLSSGRVFPVKDPIAAAGQLAERFGNHLIVTSLFSPGSLP